MSRPLASFPIAKTTDTDEAQSVLSRELSDLRFRSVRDRGRFRFEMNGIHLGRTMMAFNQFSTESEVDAGVIEDAVIISLSVGSPAVLQLDGELIGSDRLAIVSPSRRLIIRRAPESGVLVVRASIEAIEERFRESTGKELTKPIIFERSANLDQGVGSMVRRFMAYLVDDAENADSSLGNAILRSGLDDMLLSAILSLPNNYSDVLRAGREFQVAPRRVRLAEHFMEAHATEPITISDVVAECDCSRRALFAAFRRHRAYTPFQFLAESRLKAAREALLRSIPTDTVASIALACGFSHLGRFSKTYRDRFGETPSTTMRRG